MFAPIEIVCCRKIIFAGQFSIPAQPPISAAYIAEFEVEVEVEVGRGNRDVAAGGR
jgi:hypothetical protein